MPAKSARLREPVLIKQYENRRLYNTATSRYVTYDDLACMAQEGMRFVVRDAKSGQDMTPILVVRQWISDQR